MANKPWGSVAGPIQFLDDVPFKEGHMRRATVQSLASGKRVRCTVWPQFNEIEMKLGDWIFVEGPVEVYEFEDKEGNPKTSNNLSVQRLSVLPVTGGQEKKNTSTEKGTPNF